MKTIKKWIADHPNIWEFILFNILSNCATVTNFVVMWLCTGFVFTAFKTQSFSFFIFNYTNVERDLGLCGFLSFLIATSAAQTVNFFVQKNLVFRSNADFTKSVPRFIVLAAVLVIISTALPAYSQSLFISLGIPLSVAPTLANMVNILTQVVISYPVMKFVIMKKVPKEG